MSVDYRVKLPYSREELNKMVDATDKVEWHKGADGEEALTNDGNYLWICEHQDQVRSVTSYGANDVSTLVEWLAGLRL